MSVKKLVVMLIVIAASVVVLPVIVAFAVICVLVIGPVEYVKGAIAAFKKLDL